MYVITNKSDTVYLMSGEKLDYMDNGYPRLVNENVAFPLDSVTVYENITIPDGVEPVKYLFDGTSFTKNPNYVEPNKYGIPNDTLNTIQADYTEQLILEGVIGA